jgi:cytidylate kinase
LQERDARDSGRAIAPLVPAPDARIVDTSDLTLEQVLERILADLKG